MDTQPHAPEPTTDDHDAYVNAMATGRFIATAAHIVDDYLTDGSTDQADNLESMLDDISDNLTTMTENEVRGILTGVLRMTAIRLQVRKEERAPSEGDLDNTTRPTPPAPTHPCPCGHTHNQPYYSLGGTYATHMTRAATAAHHSDHNQARQHALLAYRALGHLNAANGPQTLRDFIAGLAAHADSHLRTLLTPPPN